MSYTLGKPLLTLLQDHYSRSLCSFTWFDSNHKQWTFQHGSPRFGWDKVNFHSQDSQTKSANKVFTAFKQQHGSAQLSSQVSSALYITRFIIVSSLLFQRNCPYLNPLGFTFHSPFPALTSIERAWPSDWRLAASWVETMAMAKLFAGSTKTSHGSNSLPRTVTSMVKV